MVKQAILGAIFLSLLLFRTAAWAQSPPFSTLTIFGLAREGFDRVSLFDKGSSTNLLKTEYISPSDGEYSIDIDIPVDMQEHEDYFFTDMRFWSDTNNNDEKDPDEAISESHFIIWVPAARKIYFKVYKGPQYEIRSSEFEYDYE